MAPLKFTRKAQPWFLIPNPIEKPRYRVFCLPFAGGSAAAFHRWGSHWSRDEIFAAQLPGRAFRLREPSIRDVKTMVNALRTAMQSHLDVPYILYGHSMGALIAFELARAFRRMGMPTPKALVVSGRRAPQVSKAEAVPHDLDDDQFWMRIGALYGTTHELLENAELKAMLLPSFRADFELLNLWNYEDETRFGFPIFAMGGESDPGISEADIKAWQRETTAHFDSRMFSGGHMFIQPREIEFVGALREIFDAL